MGQTGKEMAVLVENDNSQQFLETIDTTEWQQRSDSNSFNKFELKKRETVNRKVGLKWTGSEIKRDEKYLSPIHYLSQLVECAFGVGVLETRKTPKTRDATFGRGRWLHWTNRFWTNCLDFSLFLRIVSKGYVADGALKLQDRSIFPNETYDTRTPGVIHAWVLSGLLRGRLFSDAPTWRISRSKVMGVPF